MSEKTRYSDEELQEFKEIIKADLKNIAIKYKCYNKPYDLWK